MSLTDLITDKNLSPDMQLVADVCGIEVVRTLMAKLPGLRIYIPHPSRVTSIVRQYIHQRSRDGAGPVEIAAELGLSVRYVRDCLRSSS
jgi:hypothetical protein